MIFDRSSFAVLNVKRHLFTRTYFYVISFDTQK